MRYKAKGTRRERRQKGVALMMVLGSITLLSAMAVEFAYHSHITYTLSRNNLDRLQAYYLARSALGFAKLQIKIEKEIHSQLANYSQYLSGVIGSEPLCSIMPFSTGMLRGGVGVPAGEEIEGEEVAEEGRAIEEEGEEGGEAGLAARTGEFEGIMRAAAVGDFLSFGGDFSVSCGVLDSKFNLNYFYELNPEEPPAAGSKANAYEHHKLLLESLLASPTFDPFFAEEPERRRKIVNNIADWIDQNTMVDESPGFQGGYEEQYYNDAGYPVKNGKFSTLAELLLVSEVGDDLYQQLLPNITIYGDAKVNLCLADDEMVKAFVVRYSNTNPNMTPIYPDNEELLSSVVQAVREACLTPNPQANAVANAILTALGLPAEAAPAPQKTATPAKQKSSEESEDEEDETKTQTPATPVPATLTEQIVTDNRFYSFDLTGSSGDIILNIKAILHTEDRDPRKWQLLFYRIQ